MVIDLVIVTAPKPPGSRQLISPLIAVLEMAPAKVLHGAVRLHGLASSPTPETQVREACACAGAAASKRSEVAAIVSDSELLRMMPSEVVVAVVPAKAGTHIPETVVMGPRFRGDDSHVN